MFDLNGAVRGWRRRMGAEPDIQAGDLDELEDHLREIVAELQGLGLSAEEAFLLAARRLGDPKALAGEFAAASPDVRRRLRLRWMVIGAVALLALWFASDLAADLATGALAWLPRGHAPPSIAGPWFGWPAGILRLVVFAAGALLIWRLLTSDAAAARMQRSRFWSVGLLAAVLASLLVVVAASTLRVGSLVWVSRGAPVQQFAAMPMITVWFQWGLMFALPVLLLLLLWWLARPRGRTR